MTISPAPKASRQRAVLALVLACLFWGLGFPVMKALAERSALLAPGIDTWFVSGLIISARFLLGALVLLLLRQVLPNRSELTQGLWLGVTTGVGVVLQADGLAYTAASTSAFLTQGYVLLLPLLTALSTKRWPPLRVCACATLVLLGLGVLSRFDPKSFTLGRGEAETLAAALCFTLQIASLDSPRFAANRTAPVTNVMFVTIALIAAPVALFNARGLGDVFAAVGTTPSLLLFLTLACCTLVSFVLMNRFQSAVPASEAGIIYGMEPVFASLFALLLPGWLSQQTGIAYGNEALSARLLFGGGLVLSATVGLSLIERASRQAPSSSATA